MLTLLWFEDQAWYVSLQLIGWMEPGNSQNRGNTRGLAYFVHFPFIILN